ncbi:KSR2 Kinase, partial [Balaeniceps rex]|nr:KSR2 Kinase [Balaeniceps rex]
PQRFCLLFQSKLVKYFSRQLSCKRKVALQERNAKLEGFPQLLHWFRIVDIRKEVMEEIAPGQLSLEELLDMTDDQVCATVEKFGANSEECARLNASLSCLRSVHKSGGSLSKQDWTIQWPTTEPGKENSPGCQPEPGQWGRTHLSQSPKVQPKCGQHHCHASSPHGPMYTHVDRLTVEGHPGLCPPMESGHRSLPPSPRQRHVAHTPPRTPNIVTTMTPPGTPPIRRRNKLKPPGTPPPSSRKLIHLIPGFTALHRSKSHEFQLGHRVDEAHTPNQKAPGSRPDGSGGEEGVTAEAVSWSLSPPRHPGATQGPVQRLSQLPVTTGEPGSRALLLCRLSETHRRRLSPSAWAVFPLPCSPPSTPDPHQVWAVDSRISCAVRSRSRDLCRCDAVVKESTEQTVVLPARRDNIESVFSKGFAGILSKRPGSQLGSAARLRAVAQLVLCWGWLLVPGKPPESLIENPAFESLAQIPSLGLSIPQGRTSAVAGAAGRRRRVSALAEAEGGHGVQAQHWHGPAANYLPAPAGTNELISFSLPRQGPVTLSPSFSLRKRNEEGPEEAQESEDDFEEMNLSLLSARNFPRKASQTSIFLQEWDIPFEQLEIGELIGKGRFGQVFHGRWHGEVAIRLIDIERDNEDQLKAFKREVMAYRQTRHENVVLFMGACMSPPHLAIITSLCKGRTLYSVVRDAKIVLDVNKTRQIAQEIVKGMGYLHAKGILHKDLKSKNVFYDNGKVVITDFGLFSISGVLQAGRRENKLRIQNGWLCHLAPEIIRQLSPDTEEDKLPFSKHSDVFALGTIWYELHAREWPFKTQPAEAIIWQVGRGMKPNLSQIGMGKEISDILLFCWAYEQEERPTFTKLMDMLEKLPKRNRRLSHPGHFWKSAE